MLGLKAVGWKVLRKHGASCVCSLRWLHGNGAAATKRKNLHCVASAFRRAQPGSPAGGRVCRHPPDRPPRLLSSPPYPSARPWETLGSSGFLGQRLMAYRRQLDRYPPVPISPSPAAWEHWFGPAMPTAGRSGPDRHRQLPLSFCRARDSVGTHRLLILKGQSSGPQGQGGQEPREHGCWDHSACCRQLPASFSLPPCSLPGPPRSASPVPNLRVPIPAPEQGLACSWGASPASSPSLWRELLGKVLEHQGDQNCLSTPYQDLPAGPC